jgi:hypothetical protein
MAQYPIRSPVMHEQLKQAIPRQSRLGSDESSLKNNGKKNWIWCITAPLFTLFHIATSHRREEMTEAGFYRSMVTHRDRFMEIVLKPPNSNEASNITSRFQTIEVADGSQYDMSQDYFRFMFEPDIEPTNNHSEQQVRHCVIDRRITQGTRSEAGQRYHERMWTAIATCGKLERSFFRFLQESISASLSGGEPPMLLAE